MKYSLLIFESETDGWARLSGAEQQAFFVEYKGLPEGLKKTGKYQTPAGA